METQNTPSENPIRTQPSGTNLVPIAVAIIVAGGLIAGAIFFGNVYANRGGGTPLGTTTQTPTDDHDANELAVNADPVADSDHIRGPRDAKVTMIEYSDLDCPFCQRVHTTLQQLVQDYNGQVAWVYRHFPLESLHPNATIKSQVAECVAEIGGNDAFWEFTDRYISQQDASAKEDLPLDIAQELGLNRTQVEDCFKASKHSDRISAQASDAIESGGRGTPYTVIVSGDEYRVIEGALPIATFKAAIDELLGS